MFKKIIAPIIITIIVVIIMIIYTITIAFIKSLPLLLIIFIGILYLGGIIICIITLVERIREIKKGETDDLSKY
ncbi:MAG: hypothetical protein JJE21_10640 [Spirochaetaceae bacterium]|nr:hypothetical protein [Spirochaetaceae bacterium]